jgi:hypothetical protein
MTALLSGRVSGAVANGFGIGQEIHKDTMAAICAELEMAAKMHKDNEGLMETIVLLLREANYVRDIATQQLLLFEKASGNILIISKVFTDRLEEGLRGFGIILPLGRWGFEPPFARQATEGEWLEARRTRIAEGEWAGAYLLNERQVLLPGFRALGL